jgi:hypothetical protein
MFTWSVVEAMLLPSVVVDAWQVWHPKVVA